MLNVHLFLCMHCALSKYGVHIARSFYCHEFYFKKWERLIGCCRFSSGCSVLSILFSFLLGGGDSVKRFHILVHYMLRKMTDKKKTTRAFVKKNPDIPLYGELPPIVRKKK